MQAEGKAYELSEAKDSGDEAWGMLEAGTRVIDAFWWNLVGKPGKGTHYYTPSEPKVRVRVPTHLLLLAGFDVSPAMPKRGAGSANAKAAVAKGGVLVGQDVHDDILQEIAVRADLEGALE